MDEHERDQLARELATGPEVKILGQDANGNLIVELPAPTVTTIWNGEVLTDGRGLVWMLRQLLEIPEEN